MRILAVDYGLARIGLALSDPSGLVAQGLCVLKRRDDTTAADEIRQLVDEHGVERIVVGLPLNMNGSKGERALQCEQFAERLGTVTGVETALYDERLTTMSAEKMLVSADVSRKKRKQVIDAVAATILLQNYLDFLRRTPR